MHVFWSGTFADVEPRIARLRVCLKKAAIIAPPHRQQTDYVRRLALSPTISKLKDTVKRGLSPARNHRIVFPKMSREMHRVP